MSSTTVIGGKLKLKGVSIGGNDKKQKKRKITETGNTGNTEKTEKSVEGRTDLVPEEYLTEAQKKHIQKKEKLDSHNSKNIVAMSYRERVETFNYKLSTLSEHNDIPRVSAAGNG